MSYNKTFQVEIKGNRQWLVIRQAPHDPQYQVGSRIPGIGKVVAVRNECAMCGESFEDHQTASDNTAPFCRTLNSRFGDRFIKGAR